MSDVISNLKIIINKKKLSQYYIQLLNFEAKCRFCEKKYCYVTNKTFNMHIRRMHEQVFKYEEKGQDWPWRYFKYITELLLQCVICGTYILFNNQSEPLIYHLSSHSKKQLEDHTFSSWPWKYCIKCGDFEIKCIICHKNLSLVIERKLDRHMKIAHPGMLENTEETYEIAGSSEDELSLEMDTKSLSLNVANKKRLWKYFIKLPNFKAKCRFCERKYCYISLANFVAHIKRMHEHIFNHEEKRIQQKWSWKYFKYFNKEFLQCIICNGYVLSGNKTDLLVHHLSTHSNKQLEDYKFNTWPWKYCKKCGDYEIECSICYKVLSPAIEQNLNCHIKLKHSEIFGITQETSNTIEQRVLSPEINTMSMSLNIATKERLWLYYIILSDFKIKCRSCKNKYCYINITHFRVHLKKKHKKVFKYEEKKKLKEWLWRYFKYFNKLFLQCIICSVNVQSKFESLVNHLRSHSKKQLKDHVSHSWLRKYCIKSGDFEMKCSICRKNLSSSIERNLNYHLKIKHLDILEKTQETCDTIGSSERVLSLVTDTMSMPSNTTRKSELWQNYTKLLDFQLKCGICKLRYCYFFIMEFNQHVKKIHEKIYKYENDKYRERQSKPWIYFKYFNELHSQCIICGVTVPSNSNSLVKHLRLHFSSTLDNYKYRGWPWKYFTKCDDFEVECSICFSNLPSYTMSSISHHMKNIHPDMFANTIKT
nr:PREDICTED: uncharacterized protein LOC105670109 [Linepithema humile]